MAVSAPFIYFTTRNAERFGQNKYIALVSTSLLTLHSLTFPFYIQNDRVVIWGILSGAILLCPWGISLVLRSDCKNQIGLSEDYLNQELGSAAEESLVAADSLTEYSVQNEISEDTEVIVSEEVITADLITEYATPVAGIKEQLILNEMDRGVDSTEEVILAERNSVKKITDDQVSAEEDALEVVVREEIAEDIAIEKVTKEEAITKEVIVAEETTEVMFTGEKTTEKAYEEVACADNSGAVEVKGLSLVEIIDKGFQAKEEGQYHLTAEWFVAALKLKPDPDVAFYLIIESYWHWKKCHTAEAAWKKLSIYINEFMIRSTPEWRQRLRTWIKTENILADFIH